MKPEKPYADFPLFPHTSGQWAKKIRGKLWYFGPWRDPDAALARWLDQRDELLAGRTPRSRLPAGRTVADIAEAFLQFKRRQLDAGELVGPVWSNYAAAAQRMVAVLGHDLPVAALQPADFGRLRADAAGRLGPPALSVFVQRIKTLWKWAYESGVIPAPVKYGREFDPPTRLVLRRQRAGRGPDLLAPADVRALLEKATRPLDAMILLGINCGFGQGDCSALPRSAIDLAGGWVNFPRPKTGVPRRIPLWPETLDALSKSLDRSKSERVFLTPSGRPYVRFVEHSDGRGVRSDLVALRFRQLARATGVTTSGFYALRRTFRTVADECLDQPAIDAIMGHVENSMASIYRQRISDERLRRVVETVRTWLYGRE